MTELTSVDVAKAVMAALDWRSSSEARQAATTYLEVLKSGDVRMLATIAFAITKEDQTSEVRHFGFKMLQHLIRIRWDELSTEERHQMACMVIDMVQTFAKPYEQWALKSQTAALVAEVARREGPPIWKEMMQTLFQLGSNTPAHAEMVAMVLHWLPEDVTVHNEDLEGERRRELLHGLTQSLSETLPFLYKLLDLHFTSARIAAQQNQLELAKQHASVVTAALDALLAYVEWAPVTAMANYGIIEACGVLLGSLEFRLAACKFLKHIASRRRPTDETLPLFDVAMSRIFEILSKVSEALFQFTSSLDEAETEFSECLCEAMVALGSQNIQCIAMDDTKLKMYYQQMLQFFQHKKFILHSQALPLWLLLLRDKSTITTGSTLQVEKERKTHTCVVPVEICGELLDIASQKLMKKRESKEDTSEEFKSTSDFSQYRSRLIDLIRLISHQHPNATMAKVSFHLDASLKVANPLKASPQELIHLECTRMMLETVTLSVPDSVMATQFGSQTEFQTIMESLLHLLLSIEWKDPALIELHGQHFDAIGPYLKHAPSAIFPVLQKLFILLTSMPIQLKETSSLSIGRVRLQVCTSFLRISRSAGVTILPHMEAIAETMTNLQQKGLLLRGEYNLLGEALLVASIAAGGEKQKLVLEWLLGPLRDQWIQLDWQQHFLSDPGGLLTLLMKDASAELESRVNGGMWFIFHTITLFEKCLRRCVEISGPARYHPMSVHISWILPPLIKLLRCIHALWSPPILSMLPAQVRAALAMGIFEQASLLGESASRSNPMVDSSQMDVNMPNNPEGKEEEIRNWLKGIRDSGYSVLGLACLRVADSFFDDADGRASALASGLLENLQHMELRHLRLLIHLFIIPLVKSCPQPKWGLWLGSFLPSVLTHCQKVLQNAWNNLLTEGAPKTSLMHAVSNDGSLKTELMEEKLLRDLTRETCNLLAFLASSSLNQLQPVSADTPQSGNDGVTLFGHSSMIVFLAQYADAASAALQLAVESLKWPDSEAVHKSIIFCGAIVNFAGSCSDTQLHEAVGKDMLMALIQGLTLESNAVAQAELLGLFKDIFMQLSSCSSAPRQVLLGLPSVTAEALAAFENALRKTSSAKEQRQHIKSLLLAAGGEQLKALKAQKSATVITNMSSSTTFNHDPSKSKCEETETIGLASIM